MFYRKKPVVIESEQYKYGGTLTEFLENSKIQPFETDSVNSKCSGCGRPMYEHMNCPTLEGWHIVCPKDYIIKGVNGEFYPCKPDIFVKTYEEVKI